MRTIRLGSMLLAVMLALLSTPSRAQIVDAIEYYHAGLNHYFVTASTVEIAVLDTGVQKGWTRTGLSFGVYPPGSNVAGTTPVCRFYGNPAYGLDSHFYSASPAECKEVQEKWPQQWLLESYEVFRTVLPVADSGYCRSGTEPLFRLFNQRTDVNHRYLTNYGEMVTTLERGYVQEGYGTPPVAMCVPYLPIQTRVPECEIVVQHSEPVAADTNSLGASCTNHPKSFAWTQCTSNSGGCEASSATPGPVTYTVVATNEVGNSAPATRTLNWEARAPRCTIAIGGAPRVGIAYTLYESCDGKPTAFFWTNCESKGDTCIANATMPGVQTYSLYATNVWGTSATTTQTLNWQEPSTSVTPVCKLAVAFFNGKEMVTLQATCSGEPYNYLWTNCFSTSAVCDASRPASSPITYTVRGVNAFGAGSPASLTVNWPTANPVASSPPVQ